MILLIALAGMTVAMLTLSKGHSDQVVSTGQESRALYVAEAGVAESVVQLVSALNSGLPVPTGLGSADSPLALAGGSYWSTIASSGNSSYTIAVHGQVAQGTRSLEVRLEPSGDSAFEHAIFAGNSSGDPNYSLTLGGSGSQADLIAGNIYSGGAIDATGDATITGILAASDGIHSDSGQTGLTGVERPLLDLASEDYANSSDVDVAALFDAGSFRWWDSLGGWADQVFPNSQAHIFRRNPSDRRTETNATAKDDYFLEDPYEPVLGFQSVFAGGHEISLAGTDGTSGTNGNDLTYYIDGNLWIHNWRVGGLRFASDGDGTQVTFVVNGNLYISDDLLLEDEDLDGVAFIAVEDPTVADSGNIYLGDPRWGTRELMHAYLYAENDFLDNNLDASGSREVVLHGNMTAGNHVDIQRDFFKNNGQVEHSRLEINFDERASLDTISLPGLPEAQSGIGGLRFTYWRETSEQ